MNTKITFRQMESSKVLEDYINQQLAKIEKILNYEREPVYVEIFFRAFKSAC